MRRGEGLGGGREEFTKRRDYKFSVREEETAVVLANARIGCFEL